MPLNKETKPYTNLEKLLLEIFGLLILSLLLYLESFGRYILRPTSGVSCRIRELT